MTEPDLQTGIAAVIIVLTNGTTITLADKHVTVSTTEGSETMKPSEFNVLLLKEKLRRQHT